MLTSPEPGKLVVGLLARDNSLIESARGQLESRFGPVDLVSETIDFGFTDYYAGELGNKLLRAWLSFATLQPLERLARIKLAAIELETGARTPDGQRRMNLDPGLLTKHNFILATTKNYAHRIYLGEGIFAEVTLIYEQGRFTAQRWTYPDYQSQAALSFLARARDGYVQALKTVQT